MVERAGYRGYIGSRPYFGSRVPQRVQNLVIRDYCEGNAMAFLLSATEYAMPDCHMMLERVLGDLGSVRGVVLYSLFMLPDDAARRRLTYDRVLAAGAELHGAVEALALRSEADVQRFEDLWLVQRWLPHCLSADELSRHTSPGDRL